MAADKSKNNPAYAHSLMRLKFGIRIATAPINFATKNVTVVATATNPAGVVTNFAPVVVNAVAHSRVPEALAVKDPGIACSGAAAFHGGRLEVGVQFAFFQVRLVRHELDGAAHRAGAVQRCLRAAQHFDAVDVEKFRFHVAHRIDVANGDRHVAQVDTDGGRTGGRTDAADLDVGGAGAGAAVTAGGREGNVRDLGRCSFDRHCQRV